MMRKTSQNKPRLTSVNEAEEQKEAGIGLPDEAGARQNETTLDQNGNPAILQSSSSEESSSSESEPEAEPPKQQVKPTEVVKQQDAQLKSKYGNLKGRSGGSFLARKRLERGHQFFDSGDYNMVKKKPGLSGAASGSSKTKPEKSPSVPEAPQAVTVPDGATSPPATTAPIPTADAIISRRLLLFRTKSESSSDDDSSYQEAKQAMRRGSLFTPKAAPVSPQLKGSVRRGSMFPIMQHNPAVDFVTPSMDYLQKRRQSMIPSIPSKLAQ